MEVVRQYVIDNPGCSKTAAALAVLRARAGGDGSMSGGYATVQRAIDAGLVTTRDGDDHRTTRLFIPTGSEVKL